MGNQILHLQFVLLFLTEKSGRCSNVSRFTIFNDSAKCNDGIDAWHTINTTDPLLDSDEENPDEHVRLDYCKPQTSYGWQYLRPFTLARRLGVISTLRHSQRVDSGRSMG